MSADNIEKLRQGALTEPAWQLLGIGLKELTDGHAVVTIKLKPEHANFIGTAHGGVIVTLADSAFGYAVNSLAYPTVAAQFNTHFLNPAYPGTTLKAECRVIKPGKRAITAEITVTDETGTVIAKATGTAIPLKSD